jgi:hypothetical protein
MIGHRMSIEGSDGTVLGDVEWSRKPDSAGPRVGETLDGTLERTQYGVKFKKAMGGGGGGGGGFRPRDPLEVAGMQRAHAQEMALRYAQVKATAGQLPEDFKPGENLKPIIDWFSEDVHAAVQAVQANNNRTGG